LYLSTILGSNALVVTLPTLPTISPIKSTFIVRNKNKERLGKNFYRTP
jgi:hypothetical protein